MPSIHPEVEKTIHRLYTIVLRLPSPAILFLVCLGPTFAGNGGLGRMPHTPVFYRPTRQEQRHDQTKSQLLLPGQINHARLSHWLATL